MKEFVGTTRSPCLVETGLTHEVTLYSHHSIPLRAKEHAKGLSSLPPLSLFARHAIYDGPRARGRPYRGANCAAAG
jgi:hypothetical protein